MHHIPREMVIIGAGGFAREVAWLWECCEKAGILVPNLLGFIGPDTEFDSWNGLYLLGDDAWAAKKLPYGTGFVIGIGTARIRQAVAATYAGKGFYPVSLIHPDARIGPNCQIGRGSVICAGTTLTVDIQLGEHVLCNLHGTIGHDTTVGACSALSPGVHLSGYTRLGEAVEMGTGSVTLPGISVAAETVIGAGAVVNRDITDPGVYAGVPARKIR